jgi:two-component system phosphate regulon response regulator PhoB
MPANKNHILLADPDTHYCEQFQAYMAYHGYTPDVMASGTGALSLADARQPSLVVLEYMLPDMSGFDVLSEMKRNQFTRSIPVIFNTAHAEQIDRIVGLELGAEDYVSKLCDFRELLLRIRRTINRVGDQVQFPDEIRVGKLSVVQSKAQVIADGRPIRMSAMELKLLVVLMERCGRLQSRERLLSDLWGYSLNAQSRTLDTHIKKLRDKLGELGHYIETIRNIGFRMKDIPQEEPPAKEFQISAGTLEAVRQSAYATAISGGANSE